MRTARTILLAVPLSLLAFAATNALAQDPGADLGMSMAAASNQAMLRAMQDNYRYPRYHYGYQRECRSPASCLCPAPLALSAEPPVYAANPQPRTEDTTQRPAPGASSPQPAPTSPQDATPAPAQAASPTARAASAVLPCGTLVRLVFVSPASSKTAQVGDALELRVAEDVMLGDTLLVPKGSLADASITFVSHTGPGGMPGQLAFELNAMRVNNITVPLWRTDARAGDPKFPGPAVLIPVAGMFTMFRHGKDAEIKPGTSLTAFVAADTLVPRQQ